MSEIACVGIANVGIVSVGIASERAPLLTYYGGFYVPQNSWYWPIKKRSFAIEIFGCNKKQLTGSYCSEISLLYNEFRRSYI